jgi:hypothetical protein
MLVQEVDKLVEHNNSVIQSMSKQIRNQSQQIFILNQVTATEMAVAEEKDLLNISKTKVIFATKELIEAKAIYITEGVQQQSYSVNKPPLSAATASVDLPSVPFTDWCPLMDQLSCNFSRLSVHDENNDDNCYSQ